MKVLIHGDGHAVNGMERQLSHIATGLLGRGHAVVVSCEPGSDFSELLDRLAVPTVHVRPRGDLDLASALRFSRWVREERPDAMLLNSWKRALATGWAARKGGGGRLVLRVGSTKGKGTPTGEWKLRRALHRYTDAIVTNSRAVADDLHAQFPFFPLERVHVIWNAVVPQPAKASMLRRELGIGEAPLVLSVGSLERIKRHDLLIDAFARMKLPEAQLALAGSGSRTEELQALAVALGVQERVHFLGRRSDVPALLAAADVFSLSSTHDGTANAMLEAMSARVPVVVTPFGGTEVAVRAAAGRPPAGWVVEPDGADAFAAVLEDTLRNARVAGSEVQRRVEEASWRIEHWFGVERMVAAYEAVLAGNARYDDAVTHGLVPSGA